MNTAQQDKFKYLCITFFCISLIGLIILYIGLNQKHNLDQPFFDTSTFSDISWEHGAYKILVKDNYSEDQVALGTGLSMDIDNKSFVIEKITLFNDIKQSEQSWYGCGHENTSFVCEIHLSDLESLYIEADLLTSSYYSI